MNKGEAATKDALLGLLERRINQLLEGKYFVFKHEGFDERDEQYDFFQLFQYRNGKLYEVEVDAGFSMDSSDQYNLIMTERSFARGLSRLGVKEVYSTSNVPKDLRDRLNLASVESDSHDLDIAIGRDPDQYNHSATFPIPFEGDLGKELNMKGIKIKYLD